MVKNWLQELCRKKARDPRVAIAQLGFRMHLLTKKILALWTAGVRREG